MESKKSKLYAALAAEPASSHRIVAHAARSEQHQMAPQLLQYHGAGDRLQTVVPPHASPVAMMSGSPVTAAPPEAMTPAGSTWMTPPTSEPRRQPTDLYPEMSGVSDESWDSFPLQPEPAHPTSRTVPAGHDLIPLDVANNGDWPQKSVEENLDFQGLETEGPIGQAYTTDDAVTILDLRYPDSAQGAQPLKLYGSPNRRRMSGSPLTAMSDLPSYDEYSAAMSEAPSYGSDYPATSNRNSIMSSIQLSPVASPRMTSHGRPEQVRAQSGGRATPSPRPTMRSVPYSIEGPKSQRWSTGSYAPAQGRRQSPFVYGSNGSPDVYGVPQRMSYQGPAAANFPAQQQPLGVGAFPAGARAPFVMAGQAMYQRNNMLLHTQLPPQPFHPDAGHYDHHAPLPPQGLFKMLQSNGDTQALHGRYADLADPPNLFAALHEEQIPPPEEDMKPSDPELVPYEQELRFECDLYTPRWVRGHGNKREGWCGICKPGRWLVLKNSAFWYDKSFTHGVSAATGSPFQAPLETRRTDGNPDVWEGLCGSCHDWVALVSSKKKGTTWFRHAYKCHSHPKVKDGPKRRREAPNARGGAAKVKQHSETPGMGSMSVPGLTPVLDAPSSVPMPPMHHLQLRNLNQLAQVYATQPLRTPGSRPPPPSLVAVAGSLENIA